MAIASCLEVVFTTLPRSPLSPSEQLLWAIDRVLEDDYSLLDSAGEILSEPGYTQAHWREVTDTLETRLRTLANRASTTFPTDVGAKNF